MSLPSGYRRLEYIQSTGTQYIDTNFKPNNLTRVILDAQMVGVTSQSTLYCPIGCRGGGLFFELYKASASNWNLTFLWGSTYGQYFSIDYSARHTFEINKNVAKVDDSTLTYSNKTFQLSYNLFIGADNNVGSKTAIVPLKIYSCKIYDNGTIIRDFIPCQKPDGTIGLWEDVNSVFYGNAGTGKFTAGPIVVSQSKIIKLEYIQSTGTQYINSGFIPDSNTRISCKVVCPVSNVANWVFGARYSNKSQQFSFLAASAGYYRSDYGTEYGSFSATLNTNDPIIVDKNKNITTINEDNAVTNSEASFTSPVTLALFAVNTNGTLSYGSIKIYSCKIYDNGTLVRDYIPAKLADGTVGLYDKLNGLLYINAGTGTFEAGPSSLNLPVNIGGTWKDANEAFVNIGGTWKTVKDVFVNIGGAWKKIG